MLPSEHPISKTRVSQGIEPNLQEYTRACTDFSWEAARKELSDFANGERINIAYEAVDRHAEGPKRNHLAMRFVSRTRGITDLTFANLQDSTNRFANVLQSLGVGKGDCVFALAPRVPELYIAALGTLKNGSIFSPLFPTFGPEPIQTRMAIGQAKVLVTTKQFYQRKIAGIRDALPQLQSILIVGDPGEYSEEPGVYSLVSLLQRASVKFEICATDAEDVALLHFTSGTTGKPKAAVHVHAAVIMHHITGKLALDLHPSDVYWCTADPGWVTGTSYGIIAPLTNGVTSIIDEEEFDAEHWYQTLQDQKVTVWYTAPTAIRLLMKYGPELPDRFDLGQLRFIASVGEPLNPEAVRWGQEILGLPFHDNWWQTETGGIMIANYASMDIKPGSMGKPLPGIDAAIIKRHENGGIEFVNESETTGELALRKGWPSMFRDYLGEHERYLRCFSGDWYLTGDLVRRDLDGYFWFVGRDDDVIKSAGHLIGPFEVESALLEHPAVAEAGVIGKPDPTVSEIVKAYITLHDQYEASEALRRELIAHARLRLGPAVAPREIEFAVHLPKTRSGKIMRRLLKTHELGLQDDDSPP
jgi:acetyl-CoA synthetase